MRASIHTFVINTLPILWLLLCGCLAPKEAADVAQQRTGLRALAIAYGQCTSQSRGRPPRDEAFLRKFIERQGPAFLESLQVESVDELFVSPRDGEPYVVIYGKQSPVVAYEAVGEDGKRWVADNVGAVEEWDEATLREKVPDAK